MQNSRPYLKNKSCRIGCSMHKIIMFYTPQLFSLPPMGVSTTSVCFYESIFLLPFPNIRRWRRWRLQKFKVPCWNSVANFLGSLAKKLIERCNLYFITKKCPSITLKNNRGESFSLNNFYEKTYKDSLHHDIIELNGGIYML